LVVGLGLQGRFDGFLECRPAGQAATAVKLVKAKGDKWGHASPFVMPWAASLSLWPS
jgi:hypothetical protein